METDRRFRRAAKRIEGTCEGVRGVKGERVTKRNEIIRKEESEKWGEIKSGGRKREREEEMCQLIE